MSELRRDPDATDESSPLRRESARYPTNNVVAVIDTTQHVTGAAHALKAGGFLDSEIEVVCGGAAAEALRR